MMSEGPQPGNSLDSSFAALETLRGLVAAADERAGIE
jgi:hypothetical protein